MPKPTQHSRRRTRRLLLLAGLGLGAGIGITLATGSPAHADDRPQPIADTIRGAAQLPGRILDTPQTVDRPTPVRDLTVKVVDDTTKAVTQVTDQVDKATKPVPVVGRTVDKVTDVTDHLLDAATPRTNTAPADTNTPDTTHADTAEAQPATGTPNAPEPTPFGPPTPDGAGSGAPNPTVDAQQPATMDGLEPHISSLIHQHKATPARSAPTVTTPHGPQAGNGCANTQQRPGDSTRTLDYIAAVSGWPTPPPPGQPVHGHSAHHDGRTQPPSPPPG